MDNPGYPQKTEPEFNNSKGTFKTNQKYRNTKNSENKEIVKKPRYNEKDTTVNFLKSQKGFPFLLNIAKNTSFGSENILTEVEELIDFYSSWTSSFPVRKNLKVSKYDFLKSVEEFCLKNESIQEIESILKISE